MRWVGTCGRLGLMQAREGSISLAAIAVATVYLLLAPSVADARRCKPIAARPEASSVRAINTNCNNARNLVWWQTFRGRTPPGWVWINPGGCEGLIVRRRDRGYVISHGYQPRPGAPAAIATIFRGCRS